MLNKICNVENITDTNLNHSKYNVVALVTHTISLYEELLTHFCQINKVCLPRINSDQTHMAWYNCLLTNVTVTKSIWIELI